MHLDIICLQVPVLQVTLQYSHQNGMLAASFTVRDFTSPSDDVQKREDDPRVRDVNVQARQKSLHLWAGSTELVKVRKR